FSPASWKATQVGLELTKFNQDAVLSILHIYPSVSRFSEGKNKSEVPHKMDEVKSKMNSLAKDFLENPEDKIRNVVLSGNVEETMLQFIQDNDFDLVILGINGNGLDNTVGSHTLSVIEKCSTPVMIVPNKSDHNGTPTN
ncbi:MAG: universal stress protein, partial [Bacteroidota bacterium]